MSYIDSFLKILKYIGDTSKEIAYKEDDCNVKVQFSSSMSTFIALTKEHWILEDIRADVYSLFVKYEQRIVTFSELTSKKFDVGKEATLVIHFNKEKNLYKDNKTLLIFFRMSPFIEKLKENNYDFFQVNKYQKFIFLPIKHNYSNGIISLCTIQTFNEGENYLREIEKKLLNRLTMTREIFKDYYSFEKFPLPSIFKFDDVKETDIANVLNYNLVILTCKYIANKESDNTLIFKGFQNIELKIGNFFSPENASDFSFLFDLIADKEKFVDKVEITRNVFSLYLSDNDSIEKLDSIIKKVRGTIEDHFQAYIQKQIKDFFDQRKDLVKEAYSVAIEAKDVADKIINNINLMLIGLVTASLTGVFAFSKGDKFIFLLALVFHTMYFVINFIINIFHHKDKKYDIENSFDNYVAQFTILKEKEVEKIKNTYLMPAIKRLKNTLRWYIIISLILIILMSIVTYIGFQNNEKMYQQEKKQYFFVIEK